MWPFKVDLGLSDREMNRMAKTAEVLWSPIVQMSGASNTTLPGGPGNPIVGKTKLYIKCTHSYIHFV